MSLAIRLTALSPLVLAALAVDVLTPFLIWKGVLPGATRWLSHAALAALLGLGAYRIARGDRVPAALVWIFVLGTIGSVVALLQGQGILATAWGGWTWFADPLAGVCCYLLPQWPARFGELLLTLSTGILAAVAYAVLHRRWERLFYLTSFAVVAGALFVTAYNAVGPGEPFEEFLTSKGLGKYLNLEPTRYQVDGTYGYSQGRNATLVNAWNIVRDDPGTLLFGTGIGAGRESQALQTGGAGLRRGMLRMIPGSDLAAVVLELGLFGVLALVGAIVWVVHSLYRDARRTRDCTALAFVSRAARAGF